MAANGSIRSSVKVRREEEGEDEINDFRDLIQKGIRELEPSILDPRHEGTADDWIKRNSSLVRHTGKHPFNSEPPLNRLTQYGFITPVPLHFVRSRGAVPRATWNDWTVDVCGLVKWPTKFTMDQLTNEFGFREFPATIVCAGNRRKEQNTVKQTIGFNWGAAVVATSVWGGVPLRDVLNRCGIFSRKNGAVNVCFEGAEDLPGGGGCKYGTSIKVEFAMDPARDIILAYRQNGEELAADHGFPVRMIMPGFIGGKMVKWLKRIIVTTKESESYYYLMDNKVFPSHVDAELADKEAWWYKSEYVINEYNINSVITTPSHNEILPIKPCSTRSPYILRGYAYSGGGKKVMRVEVTMDGGEKWDVCMLDHPAKPNKFGKYWCWCLWSLEVEVSKLLNVKEIAVRAWDETNNTQPEKLIWNLMGLMNNCWFRVRTKICKPDTGETGIIFEHPTIPGNQLGGWMKNSASTPSMNSASTASTTYSLSQVKKHNTRQSAWIIVHGHVYDCTQFIKHHPGGADSILIHAGTDCTEVFDAIHSGKAKKMLENYRIGDVRGECESDGGGCLAEGEDGHVDGQEGEIESSVRG
ncbi:nitrate reductase [NADH]-like [Cucurbita maxima]|uniref:Nitrate reductase [NADH]-like n=1 Tax=Cucurbita maxima TaxID=3661 RepID=A0A6J1JNZ2_CUCMA|nr:nitrate reductase [NADH]-like [Cucurbita maxima]